VPAYLDALTDARVGAADPHEFLRAIRQAQATVRGAHLKYMELDHQLEEALHEKSAAPAAASGASAASA
ncbi:MAG: hypothetical protein JF586_23835, partial [Burkholderiales bacterium]|nr:hypothetical protein [Burkholderiales bacterium]